MPYVQRDETGAVKGVYANLQEGYAEEFLPDDDQEVVNFLKPPKTSYSIYKTTLWLRLTDAEAEMVMAAKNEQPAKFRGIWDDALSIQSGSEFFGVLKSFLTVAISEKRANELLAPEA